MPCRNKNHCTTITGSLDRKDNGPRFMKLDVMIVDVRSISSAILFQKGPEVQMFIWIWGLTETRFCPWLVWERFCLFLIPRSTVSGPTGQHKGCGEKMKSFPTVAHMGDGSRNQRVSVLLSGKTGTVPPWRPPASLAWGLPRTPRTLAEDEGCFSGWVTCRRCPVFLGSR